MNGIEKIKNGMKLQENLIEKYVNARRSGENIDMGFYVHKMKYIEREHEKKGMRAMLNIIISF